MCVRYDPWVVLTAGLRQPCRLLRFLAAQRSTPMLQDHVSAARGCWGLLH